MSRHNQSTVITNLAIFTGVMSLAVLYLRRRSREKKQSSEVTKVSQLNVYPIKSCGEVSVQHAQTTPYGFEYDRIMQVVDDKGVFCTPRNPKYAKLFHIQPSMNIETKTLTLKALPPPPPSSSNDSSAVALVAPKTLAIDLQIADNATSVEAQAMGDKLVQVQDVGNEASLWLQQVLDPQKPANNQDGDGCRLVKIGSKYKRYVEVNPDQNEPLPPTKYEKSSAPGSVVSLADEAPYLLTTEASLDDLNQHLKKRSQNPVDMKRFRPNIVLSRNGKNNKAWEEDTWKRIRIGKTTEFWVWQRCGRCTMTTIDRESLQRGPEPLATLSTFRERKNGQRNFGVHLIPVNPYEKATIRVGDTLEVLEYNIERLVEWKKKHA
mmetsp:Transcript_3858/g.5574  ORF Transcript_3858/g.5574 Transcript_3858/m.5574 type:complete len:378 (-) Transcript_3858:201-1334(-)